MLSPLIADCPHEQRPGMTVCLHCRHAALLVTRARRRRVLGRAAVAGAVLVLLGAGGVAGAGALQARRTVLVSENVTGTPAADDATPVTLVAAAPTAPAPRPSGAPPLAAAPALVAAPRERAVLAPVIAEGRSALRDGMSAVRIGGTVLVHFDTPLARTRRPEKFERIVRATLPAVYGAAADSLLATVPSGTFAESGDLVTELPARGVHLALPGGGTLSIWPQTRPGQDGPLVVTYRATVTP